MIFNDSTKMRYRGGYKYQLAEDFTVETPIYPTHTIFLLRWIALSPNGLLTLYSGYCSDGGSGPAIDTKKAMRAFFVHDALYQLIRRGLLGTEYREAADALLKSMYLFDAISALDPDNWKNKIPNMVRRAAIKTRANYIYLAVRAFGKRYAEGKPRQVHVVP